MAMSRVWLTSMNIVDMHNGAISITQWGFVNDRYKVNPVGQWGEIMVMAMGHPHSKYIRTVGS